MVNISGTDDVADLNWIAPCKDQYPINAMFELPHVPRPIDLAKCIEGFF
jgi:hypothetical protein